MTFVPAESPVSRGRKPSQPRGRKPLVLTTFVQTRVASYLHTPRRAPEERNRHFRDTS